MEKTNETITEAPFKTVDEVVGDLVFVESIRQQINTFVANRIARPEPLPGYHYKRDWYDRYSADFNLKYFLENIRPIWGKTSPLSSEWRNIILFICDKALKQAIVAKLGTFDKK